MFIRPTKVTPPMPRRDDASMLILELCVAGTALFAVLLIAVAR